MPSPLIETLLAPDPQPLAAREAEFVAEGLRRSETIDCFDFVPSDPAHLHAVLRAMPAGRFLEWGSGIGIGVGLAAMLGFESRGVEIDAALADASRALLADFDLPASIVTGSYFEPQGDADVYFNYCWPSQMRAVEEHFLAVAPDDATLLICHGASDVRPKRKPPRPECAR